MKASLRIVISLGIMGIAGLMSGCAGHPLDCSLGIYHADCAPGTRAYEAQQHGAQTAVASDDARCRSYGTAPGSQEYVQCRMNLDNQRAAQDRQNRALIGNYILNRR